MSRRSLLLLATGLTAVLVFYRETFLSIVDKWLGNSSYSHGLLVLLISLWLIWTRRAEVAAARWRAEWTGTVMLLVLGAIWLIARATGVLVVEQYAAVSMIPAVVLATLGREAARAIAFPLLFLLFCVPVGSAVMPALMRSTADFAVAALRFSGVPVVRDGMILSIPSGDFEVARACSGLNYLLTGVTLGVLYSYLTYSSWRKRALFIAASVVVPVVLNGIRAYLIILLAYLTDMRWGTGPGHVTFGRALFLATVFAMFWVGRRWRDPPTALPTRSAADGATPRGGESWAAFASLVAIALPPTYLGAALAHAQTEVAAQVKRISLPAPAAGWSGPTGEIGVWRPDYHGALAEQRAAYMRDEDRVEVYVAVYGRGLGDGTEMVTFRNRLTPIEKESLLPSQDLSLSLAGGTLDVREFLLPGGRNGRVVWRWYRVGDREYVADWQVKAAEAIEFLSGGDTSDRVVLLNSPSVPDAAAARQRLEEFAQAHEACLRGALHPNACAQ